MTLAISNIPGAFRTKAFSFAKPPPSPRNSRAAQSAQCPSQQRVPLADFERQRLREKIAAVTCSVPWSDQVSAKAEQQGITPNSDQIIRQLAERGIYPPRPDPGPEQRPRRHAVRMRRCDACGRIVPPNNLASHRLVRICDDCRAEPTVDPDQSAERSAFARAPGVHLGTLVEGNTDDDDANRRTTRQQFYNLGLTDAEVLAMSFTYAGYSTRRVAEFGRWSQTYVRKLIQSAARKLRRSGLVPPMASKPIATLRPTSVDPVKLDAMSNRIR